MNIIRLTNELGECLKCVECNKVAKKDCEYQCDAVDECIQALAEYENLEIEGKLFVIPCKIGDIVFDVVLCDDGKFHVIKMRVCDISAFGDIHNGKVWNIYLEDEYTKAYKKFSDFGKTIFLDEEDAIIISKELTMNMRDI